MASNTTRRRIALLGLIPLGLAAQSAADRFIGTIQSIKAESLEVVVKPDSGEPRTVKLIPQTIFQRVAPGEKDLKQAVAISAGDLATGDRVLVTLQPSTSDVRRLIVMAATDINKRNEAERQDWIKRGVGGVVTAKKDNEVTVKMRSMAGESQATVIIADTTKLRRYAPDSVRFADAKPSSVAEISVGDQLRARGQKDETGTRVTAEEIVFGTFITKAGKVTAVNPESKELTVIDSATNKPLTIKLTADSQLKKMFSFGGPGAPGGGPGSGPGGPGAGGPPSLAGGGARPGAGNPAGGPPGQGSAGPGGMGGRAMGMRAPDLAQMLERMPAAKLEDIQPGEMVVVSSTKGASKDQVTAITMVTNAERLIQMASMQQQRTGGSQGGGARGGGGMDIGGGAMGLGGMMGGMEGMQLPGMVP